MADLGTVSILVDVRGQPIVRELATDLNNVAVAETKVSAATQKVMADLQRTRDIMANVKRATDDTGASFQRFSARELQQASQRMEGFETALANTRRGMGQMGMATQQVGYQVGDFLVQVQSGTNFMVAFGQQATQLVGILPAFSRQLGMSVGTLIGISSVLGIVIPLVTAIGAAFMRTSSDAADGSKGLDTYTEALKSLTEEIQRNQEAFLKAKFGVDTAGRAQALQQEVVLQKEIADSQARILQIEAQLDSFRGGRGAAYINLALSRKKEELALEEENLAKLQENLRIIEAQNEAQNMLNGGLSVAAGIQKGLVYDKQVELQEAKDLQKEHAAQLSYMGKTRQESDNFVQSLISAYTLLANSRGVAAGLADEMARAASARQAALVGGGRSITRGGPELDPYGFRAQLERDKANAPKTPRGGRINQLDKEIEKVKELTQAEKDRQTILKSIEGSLESGFMSMVDGTKSVKSAFKSMAAEIIKELYRVLVVQRLVGGISGAVNMLTLPAGPSTGTLSLPKFATGGSMMPGGSYIVGENGPELVIPRHSGTVVNANQTANAMSGGGGFTQNLSINVSGSDAAMVRTEIAKMIPQITNATKAAVIDAKQRGGQMAAAFR